MAESAATYRVGWISLDRGAGNSSSFQSFRGGLRDLGYIEGGNLVIDARWGKGPGNASQRFPVS